MAKFILNDDGSFTQEKKRKKQTSKYEELKNVPFTGQSKFKNQTSGTYFKKSEGNAGQAIGYSALDALGNFTEGSLNFFEGMSDSARYAGANVLDFFGADKKAKEIRERARENDVEDIVNQWNHITAGDLSGTKSEKEIGRFKKVEDNSIFGEKSDQVIQGVGNSLTGATVGSYLGAPITGVGKGANLARNVIGLTSFGSSASGHATTEAYNEGANDFQAGVYGILNGAVEAGSEMLFGGLGKINKSLGFGTGALDDIVVKKLTKNIGNTLFRNIATIGLKSAGEGVEEIASLLGDQLVRRMMNMDSKTLKELAEDGTLADTFVQGTLSSLISQTPSGISSTVQGRDYTTGLTRTQQQYVNEIAQQRMVEAQKRNARLNGMQKSQIEDRALIDFQKGRLADASKLNLPGLSTKDMDLQQSAYKYGLNPNSEAIVGIKTLLDNRDIIGRYDADRFKGSNENAFWSRDKNGKREVILNPNASDDVLLEEIAIHELTHDLMSSKNSNKALGHKDIMDYVSTLDGYEKARKAKEKKYKRETDKLETAEEKVAYINEEIVADTLGKNIGSQEYIRRLIDDEPSIAKNIYDWVVNKIANKNGVKNEKKYWNNVKNNFEKAYNMEYQGKGSDTRHSFMSEKGLANAIKEDKENQVLANKLARAKELQKQGYSNEQIRQRTLWFQDPNGKWLFEIADLNSDFIVPLKEGMSKNVEELFRHDDLFEAYPQLKTNKIKVKPIKPSSNGDVYGGETNPITGTITLNSELLKQKNGEKILRKVLLHELQHQIQIIEGLEKGDTGKNAIRYYSSLGEIQSTEVEDRSKMTPKELKQNAPEVSKQYPIHSFLKKAHEKPNSKFAKDLLSNPKVAELYNEIYNNGNEGEYERAKINRLGTTKDVSTKRNVPLLRGRGHTNGSTKSIYQGERETPQKTIEGTKTKELENSSFSFEEQLENRATNLVEEDIQTRNAMLDNFKSYLEEYDITNPTQEDIDNSLIDLLSYDNDMTPAETLKYEKQYKEVVNDYLNSNNDVRYSLSEDASIEDKINSSMTMAEAKKMIQIAFQENRINDWREDGEKYADGDDWLNDVGVDEVASYIDNTHSTIINYTNPLYDRNIGFGEDYYTESILEAYQNGTLKGAQKEQATRLDTSISNNYQDDKFYSPREVQVTLELYNKANQRVTKSNSEEVYKARADFIIATHQKGVAEQLGLTQQEINKKVKSWANYTEKARNLSNQLNENVSLQNRWSGLENSSIVNTISVTNEDLSKMVKEIKGDSGEWQRQYITSTMLALDTHIDYSKLTFEFDQHQALRAEHALGDYSRRTKTIRIGDGYQNTVAHEIGHYIDNKWAEDFGFLETSNLTDGLNFEATTLSDEAKQFNKNFQMFMNDLVKSATLGYGEKTNYYQSRSETFARFVGKFVEWTKNQATNNRYGYESKYYEDNFTESQYREFVKILQEKAMLDTTMNAEKRHSQQNEGWQSFLDKNFEAKGTKTKLRDIKLPGLTNAVQEEVQKQTSNALLPIANELKELNKNLNKVMNPSEIAQLTPQDANTTPILPGVNRNKVGDGKSKFFDNIKDKTNMLSDETKTAILSSDDVKYYDKVTNKESLDKAYARLQEGGQAEVINWLEKTKQTEGKEAKQITSTDVAEGWILLKQTNDAIAKETDPIKKHQLLQTSVAYAINMRDMGTKTAQALQAFNIMARLTPEGMVYYAQKELSQAYDEMVQNKTKAWIDENKSKFELQPNEVQFILDTMKDVSTMEDGRAKDIKLAQIQAMMKDKLPPSKGAGIRAWMRISMLFNPKTLITRNPLGNALMVPVNAVGDVFASGVDKLISKKTGVRTKGNMNVQSYGKGFVKGAKNATQDYLMGINTRNIEGNRFEITEGKSFNEQNTGLLKDLRNVTAKGLNKADNMLGYVLDIGDRTFYEGSFENSLKNQMVLNNTTEVTQDMIDIATQEALSRTWQDNSEYTKAVLSIRNIMNKWSIGGYGVGDILIPFAKTPANLTKAIVDYSPVGLVNAITKGVKLSRSLTNGQYSAKTQHEFVESVGKAFAGTALYVLAYALKQSGIISGEDDEDKDVKNFLKNTLGINSYSIKIGDKSFTYDWAQPIAAPLSIMANVVDSQENKEVALIEGIIGSLDSAGSILLEQSFLQSISDVLNNQDGAISGLITEVLELPARAVPTLFKQIADLVDGTQRQTFEYGKPVKSAFNQIITKIPGLSQTLAPSVDTLGREIQKYGGKNNLFNVFLNPANVSTENISKSGQEIYRLYKETGETNIMPRVAPYYVNKKGNKIVLDTKQRAEYQKVSGSIIENNVAKLLESTTYKNMSDKDKASVVNDIVNYSYNIAQMETLGTELSKTYEKAYEYSQIGDISDYYEFRNSIDDKNAETKRESVFNYLYNSDLEDNQIGALYRNYYSSDKTINAMLTMRIPMKQFIKFDLADIQGKYNSKTGKTINGSKKNATIEYVNGLNLSKAQKAILIKDAYNTYDRYNNDIIRYVNALNGSVDEKKVWLKSIGFDNYDKDVVRYIKSQGLSQEETEKKLKDLGFTIRDGRVYY